MREAPSCTGFNKSLCLLLWRLSRDNGPSSRLVKYGLIKPLPSILEFLSIASNENVIALQIFMMVAVVDKSSRPRYRDRGEDYLSQDVFFLFEFKINISRQVRASSLPRGQSRRNPSDSITWIPGHSQAGIDTQRLKASITEFRNPQHLCYIQVSGKDHNLQSLCSDSRWTSNFFATAGLGNCY